MSLADEAAKEPRTRNGMARRSVFNTSFPEEHDYQYAIRFLRFGRVPLDVDERVPDERIMALARDLSPGDALFGGKPLTPGRIRALLLDAEVALFHLAADRLSNGESDLSPELLKATEGLALVLELQQRMSEADVRAFRSFVRATSATLLKAVVSADELDPVMLRECLDGKRVGRTKTGDPVVNAMMEGLLDDWVRRTARPVTHARSPGSAHHFYVSAVELMAAYPPASDDCPVRAKAAEDLPALRKNFLDQWNKVVRSEAGG